MNHRMEEQVNYTPIRHPLPRGIITMCSTDNLYICLQQQQQKTQMKKLLNGK